jgi:hypothetical protein
MARPNHSPSRCAIKGKRAASSSAAAIVLAMGRCDVAARRCRDGAALLGAWLGVVACASPVEGSPDDSTSAPTTGEVPDDGSSSSGGAEDSGPFVPDPGWGRWEVRFPGYAVPADDTTYVCATTSFTLEQLAHVVAFEAVIDDATVVHHMILGRALEPLEGVQPCYPAAPGVLMQWGWAPGIAPLALPEAAGFLVGQDAGSEVHFTLQIHYDNPRQESGHVDSSGVNVYFTHDLRLHNASVFSLGDVAGLAIPAGQSSFETIHHCNEELTSQYFSNPIHVFGSWLHAHRLGAALWTDHRRDGAKLGEVGRHDPYDFDLQHVEPLDVWIDPGDALVTHCVFDSSDRDAPTLGGGSTDEEMCLNYLFHYPSLPFPLHCNHR